MADADALFRDGDLAGARAVLVDIVKSRPSDQQARMFLFQLLGIAGEWVKARNQLQTLSQLSPAAQMLGVTYNQVIDAEEDRAAVFAGKRDMVLLSGAGTWADGLARSVSLRARGDVSGADAARDAAFDAAPDTGGQIDGQTFEWLADSDSRFGPSVEAIVGGKYGLIPFDQISAITSPGPKDLRDTIWFPVEIAFRSGQSGAAFLLARYPGSESMAGTPEQLGRATSWVDHDWGQGGAGQHELTLSDGPDRGLLDLRHLAFD